MSTSARPLRIGIVHPDLGIGGAERLVVDAALGLQKAGHKVTIFTSHHDPSHCFEETKDGTLTIGHYPSPFPRALLGRLHIVFATLSQLCLSYELISNRSSGEPPVCDVYMVDQLSACVPILRWGLGRRVVFYCHFPDKLLADGKVAPSDGKVKTGLLKRLYRLPADWLEEQTTKRADVILANSKFTAGVFKAAFPSIHTTPRVVYPGINISAYETDVPTTSEELGDVFDVIEYPTLLSLNRIEGKKNHGLAIESFASVRKTFATTQPTKFVEKPLRLVVGGGFDPRIGDQVSTLSKLLELCSSLGLSTYISSSVPLPESLSHLKSTARSHVSSNVTFLLNFSTSQRTALLRSPNTLALIYTPTNEHFGIGPVEGMICGVPVLACESGGPVESIIPFPPTELESLAEVNISKFTPCPTGFLSPPTVSSFSDSLILILSLSPSQRLTLSTSAKSRARNHFAMEAMSESLEGVLREAVGMGNLSAFLQFKKKELSENTVWLVQIAMGLLAVLAAVLVYLGYL